MAGIEFVASTGSTNADLLTRIATRGVPHEGQWLVARRQTAGRGRVGRHWDSPEGNFHGSTVVQLRDLDAPAQSLSLLAGLALHQTVKALGGDLVGGLQLKWPNDLLVNGAKLGGILLERSGDFIVIGLGVNLSWAPDIADRPTLCLANLGIVISADAFANRLALAFANAVQVWRTQPMKVIRTQWLLLAHPLGTRLSRTKADGRALTGSFDGLEDDGRLRLRLDDGRIILISSGEIALSGAVT